MKRWIFRGDLLLEDR